MLGTQNTTGPAGRAIRTMRAAEREEQDAAIGRMIGAASPAPQGHLDAGLIALGDRWRLADLAYDEAVAREVEKDDRTVRPEPPEAIFVRDGDFALGLSQYASGRADDRRWYFLGHPTSDGLRRPRTRMAIRPPTPEDGLPPDAISVARRAPWPEAQVRADEIVQAFDAWRSEISRVEAQSGLTAAEQETARRGGNVADLEQQIEAGTARTFDGLVVKARLAQDLIEDESSIDALIHGLVRDILAMSETTQLRAA